MIADLKPYSNYRESGLPWLGKVPEHWGLVRIKTVLRESDSRSTDGTGTLLSLTRNRGLIPHREMTDKQHSAKTLIGYKCYKSGQIVMNRMQAWSGMFGSGSVCGLVSPDYAVFDILGGHAVKFILERLKTQDLVGQFALESKGIGSGFNRLYTDRFGSILISLPPLDEQVAIVRFLNWANGQLEKAILAKRKVITLLNEQKQVIIHRAVTRGFDPSVPLKPSGIPWLGDIPQHWEVRRLKSFAHFQSGDGITSLQIEPIGKFPVYGGNGLRGYTSKYTHDGHYALIGRQGALCGNINFAMGKFFASEHAVVPTLKLGINVVWFGNLLGIMNLNQYSQSAAQPGLAVERIKNLYAPIPPSNEQIAIVSGIDRESSPITIAISRFEREIELLREYRTRLVADVVTGKLDVREAAVKLPDEVQTLEFEDDLVALEEDVDCSL